MTYYDLTPIYARANWDRQYRLGWNKAHPENMVCIIPGCARTAQSRYQFCHYHEIEYHGVTYFEELNYRKIRDEIARYYEPRLAFLGEDNWYIEIEVNFHPLETRNYLRYFPFDPFADRVFIPVHNPDLIGAHEDFMRYIWIEIRAYCKPKYIWIKGRKIAISKFDHHFRYKEMSPVTWVTEGPIPKNVPYTEYNLEIPEYKFKISILPDSWLNEFRDDSARQDIVLEFASLLEQEFKKYRLESER